MNCETVMKLVIDIPDYNLNDIQNGSIACGRILKAVKNGVLYEEHPTGEWKEHKLRNDLVVEYAFKCSNCKKDSGLLYRTDFCPNCGARMGVNNNG